jgi:hypothetical protein
MRLFSIGDIHGRLDLLTKLMDTLKSTQMLDLTQDKLIFTGDYIDRGPNSKGVLDYLKALQEAHPSNVVLLAGNHEWLAIDGCMRGYDNFHLWMYNGGDKTLESFSPHKKMPDDYIKWLASLPLFHEEPGYFFSHAPVPRENRRSMIDFGRPFTKHELTWTYHPNEHGVARNFKTDDNKDVVGVCGHIHRLRDGNFGPRIYKHYIFGDSGAGCHKDAPLCAIELETRTVTYAWPGEVKETKPDMTHLG